jgi:GT2 family glycosyltransferase
MNKTAIVILNWNARGMLEKYLPSVIESSQSERTSVYLADNGSEDGSVEFVSNRFPEIPIIRLDKNHGFAGGYNLALREIEAEYFILLNNDVEVPSGWVEPLISRMESNPTIGACMPKILSWSDRTLFEHAGAAGGYLDKYGFPFCRGRIFDQVEKDNGQYDNPQQIFWATGACMVVRASVFWEAGGFDDRFFAHMEEIDLCWRMRNRGYEIWYEPASEVYHLGGGTLPNESPYKLYLNFRNNLRMLYKNHPEKSLQRVIFIRKVFDGIAALKLLIAGNWQGFKAVYKAHRDVRLEMAFLKKQRESEPHKNETGWFPGFWPHSIIIAFFVKRKKRFSDL